MQKEYVTPEMEISVFAPKEILAKGITTGNLKDTWQNEELGIDIPISGGDPE